MVGGGGDEDGEEDDDEEDDGSEGEGGGQDEGREARSSFGVAWLSPLASGCVSLLSDMRRVVAVLKAIEHEGTRAAEAGGAGSGAWSGARGGAVAAAGRGSKGSGGRGRGRGRGSVGASPHVALLRGGVGEALPRLVLAIDRFE